MAGVASAAPKLEVKRERVAVIDVGPADSGLARRTIAAAIVAGGLDPLLGDGLDDALAGVDVSADAARLAAAMNEAQRAFGALDCAATITASTTAIGIAAARQAAELPVPELPRAWTYVLLCADRGGDARLARTAATRLRTLDRAGAAMVDAPADVLAKYPEVDALLDAEAYPIELTADVAGAVIWIDHERAGTSPLTTRLAAGDHVIAAASGGRRGFAMGMAVKTQTALAIATSEQRREPYGAIAKRVAGWGGVMPAGSEIGEILTATKARVAVVRRGDAIEAWGRAGRAEEPHRLGGEDGIGTVDEAARLVSLIVDRAQGWDDRSPDPDQALLTEDSPLVRDKKRVDEPTKWWVYATLAGAIVAGGTLLYFTETATTTQRVELHLP